MAGTRLNRVGNMPKLDNRRVIERLHALWNTGDLSLIPKIYAPAFVAHMPKGWAQNEFSGHDGVRYLIERVRNAFPDWTETVEDMIAEGDKVVTRYVSTGTHRGPFIGLSPTARTIRIDEMSIFRLERGLVMEQWCLTDDLSFGRQLGRT